MAHFNYNKPSKLGSELTLEEQRYVLAAYVHRFTGDNKPDWASKEWKDGQPYPLQFKDDKDWLANTRFQTNKAGSLDSRCNGCHSVPTWPNKAARNNGGQAYGIGKAQVTEPAQREPNGRGSSPLGRGDEYEQVEENLSTERGA